MSWNLFVNAATTKQYKQVISEVNFVDGYCAVCGVKLEIEFHKKKYCGVPCRQRSYTLRRRAREQ